MGQRANYVLVEDSGYRLYYSHWNANTAPSDLFWGPEPAVRFIRRQRECSPEEWLDEVWCEGGAVVDPIRRRLVLFGGEELRWEVQLRRVYLDLLRCVWKGWSVGWAHGGIVDLARYVGVPKHRVLCTAEPRRHPLGLAVDLAETEAVISVSDAAGRLGFYPLGHQLDGALQLGPALLEELHSLGGRKSLWLDEHRLVSVGLGGAHLDVTARRLEFWLAAEAPDIEERVRSHWPGWTVDWQLDRFETQLERTGDALRFPEPPRSQVLRDVLRILRRSPPTSSPVDGLMQVAFHSAEEAEHVEINRYALRYDPQQLEEAERERILAEALESYGGRPRG
jgi:hypothetical protein